MKANNLALITNFYKSFSNRDVDGMINCYHKDVTFEDPAFGKLTDGNPAKMWKMLLSRMNKDATIVYSNIEATDDTAKANWTATYEFGPKKRKVINNVTANFTFKDGKIIEHIDTFDVWSWSKQALGFSGTLLGWSSFMKKKIQKTTNEQLNNFNL